MRVFFFLHLVPTVPFILGRLGIPIFGNKAIPSWQWHRPNVNFFFFLPRQKMIYLLMDSGCVAQSQVNWLKGGLGCAPCRSITPCHFPSISASLSHLLYFRVFLSRIPSQWSLICFFSFTSILSSAVLLFLFTMRTPSLSSSARRVILVMPASLQRIP